MILHEVLWKCFPFFHCSKILWLFSPKHCFARTHAWIPSTRSCTKTGGLKLVPSLLWKVNWMMMTMMSLWKLHQLLAMRQILQNRFCPQSRSHSRWLWLHPRPACLHHLCLLSHPELCLYHQTTWVQLAQIWSPQPGMKSKPGLKHWRASPHLWEYFEELFG